MHPLSVRGNRIFDAVTGQPAILRGVNRSGLEYSRTPIPESDIEQIVNGWGANVIRLPFNQEWALEDPGYLDHAIEMAAQRGAYSILDLQWLDARTVRGYDSDGRPYYVASLPDENSPEVWKRLAERHRDNPAVLYDIFNEPHDITVAAWIPWALRLVDAVRSQHPPAVILVPGVNWAYDLSAYPIAGLEDVVYSTHVYANKGRDWDRAFGNLAAVAPVFAGEWGGEDVAWGAALAAYLERRGIGWTAWSWCDEPRILRDGEPTPYGLLVKALLGAQQDAEIHDVGAGGSGFE